MLAEKSTASTFLDKMKNLLIGDLHLTDRERDAYRFDIFKWIRKQQEKHAPNETILMGDICDKKDKHSSLLVNKVVESLLTLKPPVSILMGNHDYIEPTNPFFKFLNKIDGVSFITKPTKVGVWSFIPHIRDEKLFAEACAQVPLATKYLFIHQTFEGSIAESGARLSGFSQSALEKLKGVKVYAGDVHKPQVSGLVTYVGAPYQIRFGDDFTPRCILLEDSKEKNLYFEAPHKWSLTIGDPQEILDNSDLMEGDQIKVTLELAREEAVGWQDYKDKVRKNCEKLGLQVFGIDLKVAGSAAKKKRIAELKTRSHADVLKAFCINENVPTYIQEVGQSFLKE